MGAEDTFSSLYLFLLPFLTFIFYYPPNTLFGAIADADIFG